MTISNETGRSQADLEAAFQDRAYDRMNWAMLVLAVIAAPLLFWFLHPRFGFGFLLGTFVSFLNFYWLRRAVEHFTAIVAGTGQPRRARLMITFLLRYVLIGVGCYVIFLFSPTVLYGFLVGLILPAAAVFCEAIAQVFFVLRH